MSKGLRFLISIPPQLAFTTNRAITNTFKFILLPIRLETGFMSSERLEDVLKGG